MTLLTSSQWALLRANERAHRDASTRGDRIPDPRPVVRLFNPVGHMNWLATRIDADGTLFGLIDQGMGCVKLGQFALCDLEALSLPFGMRIERDERFWAAYPISVYAEAARISGSIVTIDTLLAQAELRLTGGR